MAAAAEHARLVDDVGLHRAVPVEVVLRDVEQRGRARLEAGHAVQLEARQFEHPYLRQEVLVVRIGQGLRVERRSQRGEHRRPDVAGHRDAAPGALDEERRHCRRRRLAVGAGDGEHVRRVAALGLEGGERLHEEIEFALDRDAARRGRGQQRRDARIARREARALSTRATPSSSAASSVPPNCDACGTLAANASARGGRCAPSRRESHAVTDAPARAHHCAIASPEAPRPRTSTRVPSSEGIVVAISAASGSPARSGTAAS